MNRLQPWGSLFVTFHFAHISMHSNKVLFGQRTHLRRARNTCTCASMRVLQGDGSAERAARCVCARYACVWASTYLRSLSYCFLQGDGQQEELSSGSDVSQTRIRVFTLVTQRQKIDAHVKNLWSSGPIIWHSPLGIMLTLTPLHQNFDARVKKSDAAQPMWKPLIHVVPLIFMPVFWKHFSPYMCTSTCYTRTCEGYFLGAFAKKGVLNVHGTHWQCHMLPANAPPRFVAASLRKALPHRQARDFHHKQHYNSGAFSGTMRSFRLV